MSEMIVDEYGNCVSTVDEPERIVAMAFEQGVPRLVVTVSEGAMRVYLADYSRRYGCLYYRLVACQEDQPGLYLSSYTEYWMAEGYQREAAPKFSIRYGALPMEYAVWPPQRWQPAAEESEVEYCTICDDCYPTYDEPARLCEHIYWDDDEGGWTGPGVGPF